METDRKRVHERTPTSCGKKRKRVTSTTVAVVEVTTLPPSLRFSPTLLFHVRTGCRAPFAEPSRNKSETTAQVAKSQLWPMEVEHRWRAPLCGNIWKQFGNKGPQCGFHILANQKQSVDTLRPIRKQAETRLETRSMLQIPCTGQSKRTPTLSAPSS